MKEKRGLSTVVTTLILILLVLVAIGIIWVVVKGVFEDGTGQISIGAKCLEVDVIGETAECDANAACNVTFYRKSGGDDIGGVKFVFKDPDAGVSGPVHTEEGNIEPLNYETFNNIDANSTGAFANASTINQVEVTVFFENEGGEQVLCTQTRTFNF